MERKFSEGCKLSVEKSKFNVGDQCRRKSDGQVMTVDEVKDGDKYVCAWVSPSSVWVQFAIYRGRDLVKGGF